MQKVYEVTLIISPKLNEEKQKETSDEVKKNIGSKGEIVESKNLGKKTLAYKIKKEKEGYYWLLTVKTDGDTIKKLSEKLRMMEAILRYLIVIKE